MLGLATAHTHYSDKEDEDRGGGWNWTPNPRGKVYSRWKSRAKMNKSNLKNVK